MRRFYLVMEELWTKGNPHHSVNQCRVPRRSHWYQADIRAPCEESIAARCFHHLRQLWTIRRACTVWRQHENDSPRSYISNRVDYCNSILQRVAAVHLRPFQSVLNAAAWLIVRKRKFDQITSTLRDKLTTFTPVTCYLVTYHWPSLASCRQANRVQTVFARLQMSIPDGTSPHSPSMCVQLSVDTRSRQLRSAARNNLLIPRTRTASYGPRSFAVSSPTYWNSLPLQLKSASLTLQQFCDRLKTVLFSRSYTWALPSGLCH